MGLYSFIKTAAGTLGLGVADQAFAGSMDPLPEGMYQPHLLVRNQLNMLAPGYAMFWQVKPTLPMTGDTGEAFQGQFALTPLAETKG